MVQEQTTSVTDATRAPTASGSPVEDLDLEIAERRSALSRFRTLRRATPYFAAGGLVVFGAGANILGIGLPRSFAPTLVFEWIVSSANASAVLAVILYGGLAALLYLVFHVQLKQAALDAEIDLLETKRRIAVRLASPSSDSKPSAAPGTRDTASYFDALVKINVDNLAEYYSLVKIHTNNSFRASLWAGIVGFVLIIVGVVAGFGGAERTTPATLAAYSGIATEFIAGVFFYLYNRTVRQLKDYHDSLLSVQNVLLSLKLVTDADDPTAKRDMTAQMCTSLLAGISFNRRSADTPLAPKTTRPKKAAKVRGNG